jgi:hypothetical protein
LAYRVSAAAQLDRRIVERLEKDLVQTVRMLARRRSPAKSRDVDMSGFDFSDAVVVVTGARALGIAGGEGSFDSRLD